MRTKRFVIALAVGLTLSVAMVANSAWAAVGTLADSSGDVVAWGDNSSGQTIVPSGTFTAIAGGGFHNLGIKTGGTLAGWGSNSFGQISVPVGTFTAVSAGAGHNLGIKSDGTLTGWGYNSDGQTNVPVGIFTAIAAGDYHSLGIRSDGTLAGWGLNTSDQTNVPSGTFTAIAGGYHSLGIKTNGTLASWGNNQFGQTNVPSGTFTAIAAGDYHSLGIKSDGTLAGWGRNDYSQITVPSGTFTVVAAGLFHSLGIKSDGTLAGWGRNDFGQITVPSGTFTAIAADTDHSLGLLAQTEYDSDLLISGSGLTANLNRSISVAGDATIETTTNFYNTPIADVAGKLILKSGAGFIGNGTIVAHGLELQTNFTLPANLSLTSTGPLRGTGNLTLSSGVHMNVGLAAAGPYSGSITIPNNASLAFTSTGFQTARSLSVADGGELRVGHGQRVQFNGSGNNSYNGGKIELLGTAENPAEIEFDGFVVNEGLISSRHAILRFAATGDPVHNEGAIAFSGGECDVFGDIENSGGSITVSGGGHVTFYDDVYQGGTLTVSKLGSTTSVAVFFGAFTGSGGSTGGGDIFFAGDLRPGNSPAIVTFANNVALGFGSTTSIELGGTTAGTQYDRIDVTGDFSLGGELQVSLIDGFNPLVGQSFDIVNWGTLTGTFSEIDLPSLAGRAWDTSQLYTNGTLSIVAAGLPGDYNNDGTVNAADYTVWRNNLGAPVGTLPNDVDGGAIGTAQYATWKANYGLTAGSGALTIATIPEPGAMVLLMLAATGWLLPARLSRVSAEKS